MVCPSSPRCTALQQPCRADVQLFYYCNMLQGDRAFYDEVTPAERDSIYVHLNSSHFCPPALKIYVISRWMYNRSLIFNKDSISHKYMDSLCDMLALVYHFHDWLTGPGCRPWASGISDSFWSVVAFHNAMFFFVYEASWLYICHDKIILT